MKKLLVFGPANSLHLENWINPFIDDFEIMVVTFHPPNANQNFEKVRLEVIRPITQTKLDYFFQTSSVQSIVNKFKPDVIHAHYASSYGFICSKLRGEFIRVLTVWGSDINLARQNFIHRILIDKALMKFDWINVPSLDFEKTLLAIGVDSKKILTFQYGIDLDFCQKLKVDEFSSNKVTIFSSRNWGPLYNIDKVIAGFKLAYEKNNFLFLKLAGNGTELESESIVKLIDNHPAIRILGFLSKKELVEELWKSQIYISIPNSDGMSLSVLEAMFCQNYPILSDIPPNRELIAERVGAIVSPSDSSEVADALIKASTEYKNSSLAVNVNYVDSKYNYRKNMEVIKRIYLG